MMPPLEIAPEKKIRASAKTQVGCAYDAFGVIYYFLREDRSPEQIAGILNNRYSDALEKRVSHEPIYNAL